MYSVFKSGAQSVHGLLPSVMQRGGAVGVECSFPSWCFSGDGTSLFLAFWDFCGLEMTYVTAVCLPKSI